ncbi:MAG TPA: FKBP-type peptidyl-prolyl cis-trans isomerase [Polyangiaceae bacterium]|jgi:FKBP-type peptidyl-prolyl cis-trans isomerase SlyD|nr:FKBP-type peptidyl-prolyl cis-trans isomerase [Polyangiaceae bacterium]
MQIENDRVAIIEYTVTDEAGTTLGGTRGGPTAYLHGHGNLVPGLERALAGRGAGEKVTLSLEPADAFGVRDSALVFDLPTSELPEGVEPQKGGVLRVTIKGMQRVARITKVKIQKVELDANHPWADKKVTFDVSILQVRKASKEELEHGHAHGPGGHH